MNYDQERPPFFFSKWMTYSAACLMMLSAGLAYTFSIWSDAIKTEFGYSQTKLAGIGTAGNIGGYLAVFSGLFYDSLKGYNRWARVQIWCVPWAQRPIHEPMRRFGKAYVLFLKYLLVCC